jgi:hypothetical protein
MDIKDANDKAKLAAADKKAENFEKMMKELMDKTAAGAKKAAEREKSLKELG